MTELDEPTRLCKLLRDSIWKHYPKFKNPNRDQWIREMTTFINVEKREKGYTIAEIEATIIWCQQDPFWQKTVMSPSGLRRNFQRMNMQREAPPIVKTDISTVTQGKTPCRKCGSERYSRSIDGVCNKCL